jgi:16S rRNA G966 N2-methylase RsmD
VFVDAYAGTGAVGIEALSRGASRCVFVENGRRAVEAIRENLHALGIEERASVVVGKVVTALVRQQANAPLAIAQYSARFDPGDAHGRLRRVQVLKPGDNALSFYEPA